MDPGRNQSHRPRETSGTSWAASFPAPGKAAQQSSGSRRSEVPSTTEDLLRSGPAQPPPDQGVGPVSVPNRPTLQHHSVTHVNLPSREWNRRGDASWEGIPATIMSDDQLAAFD